MEIDNYREFIELANTLNYRKAAERLCISPSALSKHIRAMEQEYGAPLFYRNKQQVSLTTEGEVLVEHAQAICRAVDKSVEAIENTRLAHPLVISGILGSPEEAATVVAIMQQASGLGVTRRLRVNTDNLTRQGHIDALRQGKVDCYVAYDLAATVHDESIAIETLCQIPLGVMVASSNPLAEHETLSLSDTVGATFVHLMGSSYTPIWHAIERLLYQHGVAHMTRPVPAGSAFDILSIDLGNSLLVLPLRGIDEGYQLPDTRLLRVKETGFCLTLDVAYIKASEDDSVRALLGVLGEQLAP